MMISLLVIDDETIIRNGLAESIGELGLFDSILCAKMDLKPWAVPGAFLFGHDY